MAEAQTCSWRRAQGISGSRQMVGDPDRSSEDGEAEERAEAIEEREVMRMKRTAKLIDEWPTFTFVPDIFIKKAIVSDKAFKLFVFVCFDRDREGKGSVTTFDRLQELTGWGRPVLTNTIKELEEHGWIKPGLLPKK